MTSSHFNAQPMLDGDLVCLRPIRSDEFETLYAVASEPLIWELHPQPTRYRREVFRTFFDGAIASHGAFVIEEKATGRIIGCSRYYDAELTKGRVTVGYTFLARSHWGGAFNLNNFRSRRAIEKLGARLVGEEALDGKPHVVYRIKRGERQSLPLPPRPVRSAPAKARAYMCWDQCAHAEGICRYRFPSR